MGHPHYARRASDGALTQLSEPTWDAPHLTKALLEAPIGAYDWTQTTLEKQKLTVSLSSSPSSDFDTELTSLLQHIDERLKFGLAEAWCSSLGYDVPADIMNGLRKGPMDDEWLGILDFDLGPEEQWARAFTEMVAFSMYGGFTQYYYDADPYLYGEFEEKGTYPISMACQHMATLGLLSRGMSFKDKLENKGCGCTASTVKLPAFTKDSKTFQCGSLYTTTPKLVELGAKPGSVLVFNPLGPSSESQSGVGTTHIAMVLRVSDKRIQFIDTGPMVGTVGTTPKGQPIFEQDHGAGDHRFTDGLIAESTYLIGVGLAGNPGDLAGAAKKIAKARPLGFVRLAIISKGQVRFVSQMLHMQYPVARLVWSLRGLPTAEDLDVVWLVYHPVGKDFTRALVDCETAKTSPASLPRMDTEGLQIANVIRGRGGANAKAMVFCHSSSVSVREVKNEAGDLEKKNVPVDGYNRDLTYSKPPPPESSDMLLRSKMDGDTTLKGWAERPSTWDKVYLHRSSNDHPDPTYHTTGVAFFDGLPTSPLEGDVGNV